MYVESKSDHIFSFSILTRDAPIVNNGKATCITVPTIAGSVSILHSHISYISDIDYGIVNIKNQNNHTIFYVEDGVVEVANNNVSILVEKALSSEQINMLDIKNEISRISKIKSINLEEDNRNKIKIKRLRMQLSIVENLKNSQ